MTTVLQYLVIAAVIGAIIFAIAVFVFGRGEQMAPLPARTSPTELPEQGMTGQDVRSVRFAMALRGYRMSDVDWALERMATELDVLRARLADRAEVSVAASAADDLTQRRAAAAVPTATGPPASPRDVSSQVTPGVGGVGHHPPGPGPQVPFHRGEQG